MLQVFRCFASFPQRPPGQPVECEPGDGPGQSNGCVAWRGRWPAFVAFRRGRGCKKPCPPPPPPPVLPRSSAQVPPVFPFCWQRGLFPGFGPFLGRSPFSFQQLPNVEEAPGSERARNLASQSRKDAQREQKRGCGEEDVLPQRPEPSNSSRTVRFLIDAWSLSALQATP